MVSALGSALRGLGPSSRRIMMLCFMATLGNSLYFLSASLHQEEYISKAIFQGKMIQFVTAALLQGSVLYIYKISK